MKSISEYLTKPIIPYLTVGAELRPSLLSEASIVFLQGGELSQLPSLLEPFKREPLAHLPVMLHLDLIDGLAKDEAAVRYVAGLDRVAGIITVRHQLATAARKLGLLSIVRLFPQDTRAVERGLVVMRKSRPDAVELLPGVAAIEVADQFDKLPIPRIAGGLVRTPDTAQRILASGCRAVSASSPTLWEMNREA